MPRRTVPLRTGRQPVDELARSPKPRGRQAIWSEIRQLPGKFGAIDLARWTDVPSKTARDYLTCLVAAGLLDRELDERCTPPGVWYRLTPRGQRFGAEAPRVRKDGTPVTQGLATEQMWRTMRFLTGAFSAEELVDAASTAAVAVTLAHARDYLGNLHRAGYLRMTGGTPGRPARYTFLPHRYTGPFPPQVQKTTRVWDPNTREIVWPAEPDADHALDQDVDQAGAA